MPARHIVKRSSGVFGDWTRSVSEMAKRRERYLWMLQKRVGPLEETFSGRVGFGRRKGSGSSVLDR